MDIVINWGWETLQFLEIHNIEVMEYSPINLILNYRILWTMTHAAKSLDNVSWLLAQKTSLKDAIWKLSWCRKVTRWQNCQYLSMFYLRPHTSDIRVFCLHFRGIILRHSQLRYSAKLLSLWAFQHLLFVIIIDLESFFLGRWCLSADPSLYRQLSNGDCNERL